ncbi:agamous-like MADS-box protein AGL62 [Manihot esculenta]|uniref:MADS-box domain-containing protein n=1 Tax=Manihot esculenta TaxID=3983 RepID=A0A2C9UFE7_MANES|nr:agamous-like MADS-box protein AGL62 [Manihot esculenta]OAY29124.1 hypothetical protein MANES_15G119400v8 [Manihot esculenta]
MATQTQEKKTKGRQRIEMKKIENEDDKLITFSKRRSGIYKKASELVILTGTELAFVVFSPAGKPFSFAHPSVDAIINRFSGEQPQPNIQSSTHPLIEAHRRVRIEEINRESNELLHHLDSVKEKGKQLKQKMTGNEIKGWWDTPIEEMSVQQMLEAEAACGEIRAKLINKLKAKTYDGACAAHHQAQIMNPFFFP